MSNANGHITWRYRLEGTLVVIVTLMPLAVAIRYKWGENILPLALAPLLLLLFVSARARTVLTQGLANRLRSVVGVAWLAAFLWLLVSIFWAVDPRLAAIGTAKAVGSMGAALAVALVLNSIESQRIFPWLTGFTALAGCVVIFTSLSGGQVHRLFNCCEGGMQPHLSGGAVIFALLVWPCVGWWALKGQRRSCILLIVLACLVVVFAKSGAAWLAFFAGTATVLLGLRTPRLACLLPFTVAVLGFFTAPFLSDLTAMLDSSGLLGRMSAFHASERAQIWTYYNDLFWQRPWAGYGFRAEEILGHRNHAEEFTRLIPPPYAAFHAHNISLQILLEFGIIGAALALAVVAANTWALYAAEYRPYVAFAVAPATAALAAAHVNFSIWEWWWLASVSLAIIFGCRLLRNDLSSNAVRRVSSVSCGSAAG